jgi:hypothetical protein
MRGAPLAIFSIVITAIFSCQKQVSKDEFERFQGAPGASAALIDSIYTADSVDTSGIDYVDNIYDLSLPSDSATKAYPVYHSVLSNELPCETTDSSQYGCIFDETDVDGNGTTDIPGANNNKLIVNKQSGVIDLAASLEAGVLGENPQNGSRRSLTFFYRLDDNSRRTLEQVTIRLVYYKRRSDVPPFLVNAIAARRQQYLVSSSSSITSSLTAFAIVYKPKRPPLIVIVSGY